MSSNDVDWNIGLCSCMRMKGCAGTSLRGFGTTLVGVTICLPCSYGAAMDEAGLCSCCTSSCCATIAPCCTVCWNRRAVRPPTRIDNPAISHARRCNSLDMRAQAVSQIGIEEPLFVSIAIAILCSPCSMCQETNEVLVHSRKVRCVRNDACKLVEHVPLAATRRRCIRMRCARISLALSSRAHIISIIIASSACRFYEQTCYAKRNKGMLYDAERCGG